MSIYSTNRVKLKVADFWLLALAKRRIAEKTRSLYHAAREKPGSLAELEFGRIIRIESESFLVSPRINDIILARTELPPTKQVRLMVEVLPLQVTPRLSSKLSDRDLGLDPETTKHLPPVRTTEPSVLKGLTNPSHFAQIVLRIDDLHGLPIVDHEVLLGILQLCGEALQTELGLTHLIFERYKPLPYGQGNLLKKPDHLGLFDLSRPGADPVVLSGKVPDLSGTGMVFWNYWVEVAT